MAWSSRGLDRRRNSGHDHRFSRPSPSVMSLECWWPPGGAEYRTPVFFVRSASSRRADRMQHGDGRAWAEGVRRDPRRLSSSFETGYRILDAVAVADRASVADLAVHFCLVEPLIRRADSSYAARASACASSAPWDAAADGPAICCRAARHGTHRSCRRVACGFG